MKATKQIRKSKPGFKGSKMMGLCQSIELATGLKLMATNENDAVDGYINYYGNEIEVFLYDEDEPANSEHKTTFRKATPTQAILDKINQEIDRV